MHPLFCLFSALTHVELGVICICCVCVCVSVPKALLSKGRRVVPSGKGRWVGPKPNP